jgi:hypothetical protein
MTSAEAYAAACAEHRAASRAHDVATLRYVTGRIGTPEYAAARANLRVACASLDRAEAAIWPARRVHIPLA